MTRGDKPKGKDPVLERTFRGSWSGYEKDNLFYNTDGPSSRFYNAPYLFGLDFDDDGRSVVPVDVDGDGDLDLVCLSLQGLRVVENTLPARHFARLRLAAVSSEPLALGANVHVHAGGVTQQDYVKISDGYLAQLPHDLHFGLGDATVIDSIEVAWPGGKVQTWKNVPADLLVELREGEEAFRTSRLPAWPAESRPRRLAPGKPGDTAQKLDGTRSPLAPPGIPAVINFWSTTCAPCKRELPALAAAASSLSGKASFAGVCADPANVEVAREMIEAARIPYPQFLGDEATLAAFFGPGGSAILPSTFVFDSRGKLIRVFQREVSEVELRSLLEDMQTDQPSPAELDVQAQRLLEDGKALEALELFEWSLRIAPNRMPSHLKRGVALFTLGRLDEAITELETCLRLDPEDAWVRFNLAGAYHKANRMQDAITQYNHALRIGGDLPEFLVGAGRAYAEMNDAPKAMDAFSRAIKANPKSAQAWKWKSKLHRALRQNDDAEKCLTMAVALDPADEEARGWLKAMAEEKGR